MIWLLTVPFIFFFTFRDLYMSGFPGLNGDSRNFLEWCFFVVGGCFVSCIISLAPVGVWTFIGYCFEYKSQRDKDYPLISLREKDGVSGKFYFLGAGAINDQQYYFWYIKKDGFVAGGKTVRCESVRIFEHPTPMMRTFKAVFKNKLVEKYGWIVGNTLVLDDNNYSPDFYIPAGSIKEGHQL